MHPDQKYIDALLNHDLILIGELYGKCFPAIRSFVLLNKGSEANAEDTFQDALVDLYKKVKTQQFTLTSSLCSYLKGMCIHKWMDELRKRKRERVTFTDFEGLDLIGEDSLQLTEEHRLRQGRVDLIRQKFSELGESCKELLQLSWTRKEDGKKRSTEEIAGLLNITEGYARKRKSDCIVKLMKLVAQDPEFEHLK